MRKTQSTITKQDAGRNVYKVGQPRYTFMRNGNYTVAVSIGESLRSVRPGITESAIKKLRNFIAIQLKM